MRYDRQVMLPEIGIEGQQKLKQAKVLLVGVGGLGSPIALYLTAVGVGTIGLVDDDRVSLTNLQRQVLYTESEIDRLKVDCASARLQALNSETQINTYPMRLKPSNVASVVSAYDIVIDACDNFETRYLLDEACEQLGIPYVYGAISGFEGQVSVFHYGEDPRSYRLLYPNREALIQTTPFKGVLGVTPAVTGSIQASEAIKIITGCGSVLSGKLWTIDLRTLESHIIAF